MLRCYIRFGRQGCKWTGPSVWDGERDGAYRLTGRTDTWVGPPQALHVVPSSPDANRSDAQIWIVGNTAYRATRSATHEERLHGRDWAGPTGSKRPSLGDCRRHGISPTKTPYRLPAAPLGISAISSPRFGRGVGAVWGRRVTTSDASPRPGQPRPRMGEEKARFISDLTTTNDAPPAREDQSQGGKQRERDPSE